MEGQTMKRRLYLTASLSIPPETWRLTQRVSPLITLKVSAPMNNSAFPFLKGLLPSEHLNFCEWADRSRALCPDPVHPSPCPLPVRGEEAVLISPFRVQ